MSDAMSILLRDATLGLLTAFSNDSCINAIPCKAMPSHIGCQFFAKKASILCVRASMPVAAVINGGKSMVSIGSAKIIFAKSFGAKSIFFWCVSSSAIMALLPTSLPVPAVVGMVIKCGTSLVTNTSPPIKSSYLKRSSRWFILSKIARATSIAAPPPMPIIQSRCVP